MFHTVLKINSDYGSGPFSVAAYLIESLFGPTFWYIVLTYVALARNPLKIEINLCFIY
jgi:hypothetical protein